MASQKNTTTGRALGMASMGAGIAGSYVGYLLQRVFLGEAKGKIKLKSTHVRAARRMADEMQALRGPAMKLGQMLSLQTGVLPDEVLSELATLQMEAPGDAWRNEMRYLPKAYVAKLAERYAGKNPPFNEDMAFALAAVRVLHEHGAGLLLGTDALKFNVMPGFSAIHELSYFVRAGLTPYEALQTATDNPARALRQESLLGTIDVGKRADLILLEANPLEGVENVARRAGVLVRGRWLTEAELQRRLAEVARRVVHESDGREHSDTK